MKAYLLTKQQMNPQPCRSNYRAGTYFKVLLTKSVHAYMSSDIEVLGFLKSQ